MDYQDYDDYMRSVLGYRSNMGCTSGMCMNPMPFQNMPQTDDDLERMYPDTYRIVYPMIVSVCNTVNINMPISEAMVDRMTDDIYDRVATDVRISVDLNVGIQTNREDSSSDDSRQMPRRRNRFLRDFIRVLLLRDLLRRRRRFPFRPF